MKTLEKFKKEREHEVPFESDNFEYVKYKDFEFIKPRLDSVYIIPFLIEQNAIILKEESVPSYQFLDKQPNRKYLTIISGAVKDKETVVASIERKLRDDAGVNVLTNRSIDYQGPMKINKDTAQNAYFSIVPLYNSEYVNYARKLDSAFDETNRIIKCSISDIDNLEMSDLLSSYLLEMFKKQMQQYYI